MQFKFLSAKEIGKFETKFKNVLVVKSGLSSDEISTLSKREFNELINIVFKDETISRDNIHLYYEFMSDEEIKKYSAIIDIAFNSIRFYAILKSVLNINRHNKSQLIFSDSKKSKILLYIKNIYADTAQIRKIGIYWFGIKDTLKPIVEYIEEIKESAAYKEYLASLA